jgi:uncharacterized protein HemX
LRRGEAVGILAGIPLAVKDLEDVAGNIYHCRVQRKKTRQDEDKSHKTKASSRQDKSKTRQRQRPRQDQDTIKPRPRQFKSKARQGSTGQENQKIRPQKTRQDKRWHVKNASFWVYLIGEGLPTSYGCNLYVNNIAQVRVRVRVRVRYRFRFR